MPNDAQRIQTLKLHVDSEFADKVLVSQDIVCRHEFVRYGGHGHAHILEHIGLFPCTPPMDDLARECPSRGRAVNKCFRPGEGYSKRVSVLGRGARISYCPGEGLSGIVSSIGVYTAIAHCSKDGGQRHQPRHSGGHTHSQPTEMAHFVRMYSLVLNLPLEWSLTLFSCGLVLRFSL